MSTIYIDVSILFLIIEMHARIVIKSKNELKIIVGSRPDDVDFLFIFFELASRRLQYTYLFELQFVVVDRLIENLKRKIKQQRNIEKKK